MAAPQHSLPAFQQRRSFVLTALQYLIVTVVVFYGTLCIGMYLVQERLLFFPERLPPGSRYTFDLPHEEFFIPVEGAELHTLWFRTADPRGVVLYFHGNGGNVQIAKVVAPHLIERGYDVVMADYRGYGLSTGAISSEAQLLADAAAVYAWVMERYPETQIVLYGSSLGSGFASWLAANHQPRLLILESPYYSIEAIARRRFPWAPSFLLKYPLRSYSWIGQVRCPVVIFHGTNDHVIPFADGEQLAAEVTAPLSFYRLEGGRHVDSIYFRVYQEAIDQVLGASRQ